MTPPPPSIAAPSGRPIASQPGRQHGTAARRASVLALVVALAVAGAVVAARPAGVARISVLDVGQGDAILVEGTRGGRLLIDGGPDPNRLLVALDKRIPPWDRRIDAVILSHPHEDHVAGLAILLERYRVDRVFEPGMRGPGPGYAAWARRLAAQGAPARLGIAAGDRLTVDEISLRVLWPVRGEVPALPPDGGTGINNVSVVLLGQVGPRRFLLMGDVEEGIDPSLLADDLPRVDFLKVAHHGSRTATTEPFVEAVRPKVAVASAGTGNPYGHPAASTLARLAASGARVLRTDRDGTVVATFGTDRMTVETEGGGKASARPLAAEPPVRLAIAKTTASPQFLCAIPIGTLVPALVPAGPSEPTEASSATREPDAVGRGTFPNSRIRPMGPPGRASIRGSRNPRRSGSARYVASRNVDAPDPAGLG